MPLLEFNQAVSISTKLNIAWAYSLLTQPPFYLCLSFQTVDKISPVYPTMFFLCLEKQGTIPSDQFFSSIYHKHGIFSPSILTKIIFLSPPITVFLSQHSLTLSLKYIESLCYCVCFCECQLPTPVFPFPLIPLSLYSPIHGQPSLCISGIPALLLLWPLIDWWQPLKLLAVMLTVFRFYIFIMQQDGLQFWN